MAASVRISRKTALALASEAPHPGLDAALAELRAALRPRPKKSLSFVPRKKAKAAKKRSKRTETAEIREAVMGRACERCEACGFGFDGGVLTRLEMDHFFGRVRAEQSERNCWAICRLCHREKTRNDPSARHWLETFIQHAEKHGYSEEAGMATRLLGKHQAKAELSAGVSNG